MPLTQGALEEEVSTAVDVASPVDCVFPRTIVEGAIRAIDTVIPSIVSTIRTLETMTMTARKSLKKREKGKETMKMIKATM